MIVLIASVVVLITFTPESVMAPLQTLFAQFRVNNVSAIEATDDATSVTDVVSNAVKKALR